MAGPLRRVSQNHNWTLKRAHNDLHNSISPELQSAPAPGPSPNTESAVSPWDSARLQWKFKSEYDELRGHLERSSLILLGWWLIIKHLTKAAAEHFIAQPDQAVSNLYKQSARLPTHDIFSVSVWGLLAALFRYAVPRVASPAQSFFSRLADRFGANNWPSASPPLPDEKPESTAHPEGSPTITAMSDTAHSALDESLIDALRDGIEKLHSAMHIGEGKPFHGSPSLHGDIKKPHDAFKSRLGPATHGNTTGFDRAQLSQTSPDPTQREGALKVIITRPQTDDVSAFGN